MGIYEYQCPKGHITERFVSLAQRSDHTECDTCMQVAELIVSAVKTTFHANDRKAIKRSGH